MRLALFAATALSLLAAPSVAGAARTERVPLNLQFSQTVTHLCAFPVTIDSTVTGTQTNFFNNAGVQTRSNFSVTETDVFRANGNVLTGLPYHTSLRAILDPSDPNIQLKLFAMGVVARVPLPDGKTFLSAGRLEFTARGFLFALTPDTGHSGDVDAFCAALAA
jgi:hypothetical protein